VVGFALQGTVVSLDGVYDCRMNRKAIFNRAMVPNINANPRGRKLSKRGRKPLFNLAIFQERFHTIERVFGWEDKFRRLPSGVTSKPAIEGHFKTGQRNHHPGPTFCTLSATRLASRI
ncbi:MAG TPA: hypothetical protein VGG62_00575, partial [Terracidiphilus sp.]